MVARRQLDRLGIDADRVRCQVSAGRWAERTPRVISTVTGELTFEQRCWLAVLHAGPRSMLGNLTAAAHHDLKNWDRPQICVMVDDELSFDPVPGVDFFRSRRPFEVLVSRRPGIPRCRLEPAVLLWAAYEAPNRAAHGVIAATVQQRLTTPGRLIAWVDLLHPLRRAKPFKRTLSFVDAGAHSGAELEVGRMCRRFRHAAADTPEPAPGSVGTSSMDRCRVGPRRWPHDRARGRRRLPHGCSGGRGRRTAFPPAHDTHPDGHPLHGLRADPRADRGRHRSDGSRHPWSLPPVVCLSTPHSASSGTRPNSAGQNLRSTHTVRWSEDGNGNSPVRRDSGSEGTGQKMPEPVTFSRLDGST